MINRIAISLHLKAEYYAEEIPLKKIKNMFNIEKSIQTWKRQLRRSPSFEDGDIAELESHLRDEIVRLITEKLSIKPPKNLESMIP